MATNVAVTYTYVNGTAADGTQVNQNFTDIVNWINTNAVHLDGAKPFTGAPTYAADPVSANQLSRKAYVDGYIGGAEMKMVKLRRAAVQSIPNATTTDVSWDTEDSDVSGFIVAPGTTLTVPAGCGGVYLMSATVTWASAPGSSLISMREVSGPVAYLWGTGATPNAYGVCSSPATTMVWSNVCALGVGASFKLQVVQSSGAAVNATVSFTLKRLSD